MFEAFSLNYTHLDEPLYKRRYPERQVRRQVDESLQTPICKSEQPFSCAYSTRNLLVVFFVNSPAYIWRFCETHNLRVTPETPAPSKL